MTDLLNLREQIVHELLSTKCDPYADDIIFGVQRGYHKGLLKAKELIDSYIDKELDNMAKEHIDSYIDNDLENMANEAAGN